MADIWKIMSLLNTLLEKLDYMEEKLVRIETKLHLLGEKQGVDFRSKDIYKNETE